MVTLMYMGASNGLGCNEGWRGRGWIGNALSSNGWEIGIRYFFVSINGRQDMQKVHELLKHI